MDAIEPSLGEIVQLTAVFEVLPTVAVNDAVDTGQFVLLGHRVVVLELRAMLTGVVLQAIKNPRSTSENSKRASVERCDTFRLTFPRIRPSTATPAMGSVRGSHGEWLPDRLSARWRSSEPVPGFGPVDVMVIVTGVEVFPAAIDDGVNVQLALVSVVSAGEKLQPKVTVLVNAGDETGVVGVARKVYVRLVCPARTVCEVLPVLVKVKTGASIT